jgi:uncharacterized protein
MYEWDDAKNAANIAKHGVSFELAMRIFDGPVLTTVDRRKEYGEVRELSIGSIAGVLVLLVVHTDRRGIRRIISARRAKKAERTRYEKALRQGSDDL